MVAISAFFKKSKAGTLFLHLCVTPMRFSYKLQWASPPLTCFTNRHRDSWSFTGPRHPASWRWETSLKDYFLCEASSAHLRSGASPWLQEFLITEFRNVRVTSVEQAFYILTWPQISPSIRKLHTYIYLWKNSFPAIIFRFPFIFDENVSGVMAQSTHKISI